MIYIIIIFIISNNKITKEREIIIRVIEIYN